MYVNVLRKCEREWWCVYGVSVRGGGGVSTCVHGVSVRGSGGVCMVCVREWWC